MIIANRALFVEPVGVVTAFLIVLALYAGQYFATFAFVLCSLLGAAAAINASGVGSIQPAHLLLAPVAAMVLTKPGNVKGVLASLHFPQPGFWLLCTWIYGVLGAVFIPRLAEGAIMVNPIGVSQYGVSFIPVPIGPTTGNITQIIYFTGDIVCFLICLRVAGTIKGFRILSLSLVAYCVGDILFALVDLMTYYTGTQYLLEPVRNANYTIYVDTEATISKRIIGSFTEASAFAAATLGVFGFSAQLCIEGIRSRFTLPLTLAALTLLLFSTASTAYVSLPFCLAILYGRACWYALSAKASPNMLRLVFFLPLLGTCVLMAVMLHVPTYNALKDFLDAMVFQKSTTQSGLDRGRINVEAWSSFIASGGIGLGIGSVRASSFILAVAANLGLVGGATYAAFIGTALSERGTKGPRGVERSIRVAARMACLCLLISACASGALIDLGLPFFIFAALAASRPIEDLMFRGASRIDNRHPSLTTVAWAASLELETSGRPS